MLQQHDNSADAVELPRIETAAALDGAAAVVDGAAKVLLMRVVHMLHFCDTAELFLNCCLRNC